jgi:predicted transcriptional regulator
MARPRLGRPTDGELAILRVLWARGASTVREVHDRIVRGRPASYTTTLKLLQIMTDKGLVAREDWGRAHRYEAAASEADMQQLLVNDLAARAFGGSAAKLVMRALATERASPEELRAIERLLRERRRGAR